MALLFSLVVLWTAVCILEAVLWTAACVLEAPGNSNFQLIVIHWQARQGEEWRGEL